MATQKQIEANRVNAQKSTGPTSAPGIERAKRNSLKHGLCSQGVQFINDEDKGVYQELVTSLLEQYVPTSTVETFLVEKIASTMLRIQRADRLLDGNLYDLQRGTLVSQLSKYITDASGLGDGFTVPPLVAEQPDGSTFTSLACDTVHVHIDQTILAGEKIHVNAHLRSSFDLLLRYRASLEKSLLRTQEQLNSVRKQQSDVLEADCPNEGGSKE